MLIYLDESLFSFLLDNYVVLSDKNVCGKIVLTN